MKHFFHSGDLGDVIYSLPAVRALGGGWMHLRPEPGIHPLHEMTPERVTLIEPLLRSQSYVEGVSWTFPPDVPSLTHDHVNLNNFRRAGFNLHTTLLPSMYLRMLDLPESLAETAWLEGPDVGKHCVIFARSARYQNDRFPWKRAIEKYGAHARFIGTASEHVAFNQEFDCDIPHQRTDTLKGVRDWCCASWLFIGNQSAPMAIAAGLGVPIVCEVCLHSANCLFHRPNFVAGLDGTVRLPDLEEFLHAV